MSAYRWYWTCSPFAHSVCRRLSHGRHRARRSWCASLGYPTSAGYQINKINGNGVVDEFGSLWAKNFTILDK